NSKRYSKEKEKEIIGLNHKVDSLQHEVDSLKSPEKFSRDRETENGFSLQTNDKAREYFEDQNIDVDSIASAIEGRIISKNRVEGGNPLVPYHGLAGTMQVNRIKILN